MSSFVLHGTHGKFRLHASAVCLNSQGSSSAFEWRIPVQFHHALVKFQGKVWFKCDIMLPSICAMVALFKYHPLLKQLHPSQ